MSVSKGIFVYKPENNDNDSLCQSSAKKSKRSPKKRSSVKPKDDDDINMIAFQHAWTQVLQTVDSVNSKLNASLFDSLKEFCNKNSTVNHCIPSCSVVTGVNIPDHHSFFSRLCNDLKANVSELVALVHSKDCANIKQTIQNIVRQLVKKEQHLSWDECNMSYLNLYYKSMEAKQPIVIVIEDLEAFSANVIQDMILICSNYVQEMPIQMIFGISTATSAIETIVPNKALAHVMLQCVRSQPATVLLNQIIENVLINPKLSFRLGPKVFTLLLDLFLYHNFSTSSFVSTVKLCMLEHFKNNQLSYVFSCNRFQLPKVVGQMQASQLELFRQIPSFMKYVEQQAVKEQKRLLLDDEYFRDVLLKLLTEHWDHYNRIVVLLHALISLVKDIPGHPLGKQIRESFSLCLSGQIVDSDGYNKAFKILTLSSKIDLMKRIGDFQEAIAEKSMNSKDEVLIRINAVITQKLVNANKISHSAPKVEDDKKSPKLTLTKSSNTFELQEQLKQLSVKNKSLTNYELFRTDILDTLHSIFKENLTSPFQLAFHELFYFEDSSVIKKHLIVSPRACLQRALSNPQHYFKCECCAIKTNEDILQSMPDICITFKLLQECGRLVNLYDWLQAFTTVVSGEETTDKPDTVLQARFIRAVSELQFLGYIKSTKRKTDHMARLTWA